MTNKLKRQCLYLVTEDRHRAACEASHWLRTYCRHYATIGSDQQTTSNLTPDDKLIAEHHLATLRRLGKLREDGYKGNFIITS